MRRVVLLAIVSVIASVVAGTAGSAGSGQARWVMTDLGTLGGDFSTAIDLNERGQVVGTSQTASRKRRVFLWEKGRMFDLGPVPVDVTIPNVLLNERGQVVWSPNGRDSVMWERGVVRDLGFGANAINDRGQIVGQRGTGAATQAVLWENGRTRELRPPGGKWSGAIAINDRGQVVVWSQTNGVAESSFLRVAERHFLWQNSQWTNIGRPYACAINERGQIVGHDFLWQNGRVTTHNLDPAVPSLAMYIWWYCFPWTINNRGQIIGVTKDSRRASLWGNGKTTFLGRAGGAASYPEAINDLGQVVGKTRTPKGGRHAFVWENGIMTDLARSGSGSKASSAHAINNKGQIVGASETGQVVRSGTPDQTAVKHAVLWTLRSG